MNAYGIFKGDLLTSTVRRDSALTSEHGCFYKHIYPRLTTPLFLNHYLLVIPFLISMCHDNLLNWPVNLSLISYIHKPVSSLSIKLLATKPSVLLTKKDPFVLFQSTNKATEEFQRKYRPKHFEYINENEDNSVNVRSDKKLNLKIVFLGNP